MCQLAGLTFELTGILRQAGFGRELNEAQTWTAAKCPVERMVRRQRLLSARLVGVLDPAANPFSLG